MESLKIIGIVVIILLIVGGFFAFWGGGAVEGIFTKHNREVKKLNDELIFNREHILQLIKRVNALDRRTIATNYGNVRSK